MRKVNLSFLGLEKHVGEMDVVSLLSPVVLDG
jgi:hypothetical protein